MSFAKNVNIESSNYDEIVEFCKFQNIDLVVIGPEQPLVDGLSDLLKQNNINVFGPSGKAALIEGDKAFAKELMKKYDIPTADFEIFEKENYEEAIEYLNKLNYPIVVKACGLAAGKGVLICNNKREAVAAIDDCSLKNF
jgi:phosphoribosylamine--glycine ligase